MYKRWLMLWPPCHLCCLIGVFSWTHYLSSNSWEQSQQRCHTTSNKRQRGERKGPIPHSKERRGGGWQGINTPKSPILIMMSRWLNSIWLFIDKWNLVILFTLGVYLCETYMPQVCFIQVTGTNCFFLFVCFLFFCKALLRLTQYFGQYNASKF